MLVLKVQLVVTSLGTLKGRKNFSFLLALFVPNQLLGTEYMIRKRFNRPLYQPQEELNQRDN